MGIIPINCCPAYFFNQNLTTLTIPPGVATEVIQVVVTTQEVGDRVRIDSMIETIIAAGSAAAIYSYNIIYRLFRDTTQLTLIQKTETNKVKQADDITIISDALNITWTDVPPGPGTFTYRITVQRSLAGEENILNVDVQDRSIDAIVFPPTNP
jgi:hypothetical protein